MSTPGSELLPTSASQALVPSPRIEGTEHCANCGTTITDNYCGHCGQRREHHVHSLSEFLGEAAEVITHADSRVWRTFVPLLFRPGFLTQQYLAGRRASFLPPFRLYIVLSVMFFLMISLAQRVTKHADNAPLNLHVATVATAADFQKEIDATEDPEEKAALIKQRDVAMGVAAKVTNLTRGSNCETKMPTWIMQGWLRTRMVDNCQKIVADNGHEFSQVMIHNAGRAMFLFLPLIAAFMKLLYWHPRRYYVEHLLLLLHNHAFIFVAISFLLGLQMILPSEDFPGWVSTVLWLYIIWYLYRSMRRVYAQSRIRTILKFATLSGVYFVCLLFTFVLTFAYSAVTL